eukprot:gene185-258_t
MSHTASPTICPSDAPPSSLVSPPTESPHIKPSSQPTTKPSGQPSSSPTYLTRGTLPSARGLSVLNANGTRFRIVLPFIYADDVVGDGFGDIVMSDAPSGGTNYVLFGRHSLRGIKETSLSRLDQTD